MKAITKKYKKARWIDTKFSRHYVTELAQAFSNFKIESMLSMTHSSVMYKNVNAVITDDFEGKRNRLLEITVNSAKAIREIGNKYLEERKAIQAKWASEDNI